MAHPPTVASAAAVALANSIQRGASSTEDVAAVLHAFPQATLVSVALLAQGEILVSSGNLLKEGSLTLTLLPRAASAAGLCVSTGQPQLIRRTDRQPPAVLVQHDCNQMIQQHGCTTCLFIPLSAAVRRQIDGASTEQQIQDLRVFGCLSLGFPASVTSLAAPEFVNTTAAVAKALGAALPGAAHGLLRDMRFLLQQVPQAGAATLESSSDTLSGESQSESPSTRAATSPAQSEPAAREQHAETEAVGGKGIPEQLDAGGLRVLNEVSVEEALSALQLPETPTESTELRTEQYRRRSSDLSRGEAAKHAEALSRMRSE